METAHDRLRRAEILFTHRKLGRVCSACGQSWECTDYAWATAPSSTAHAVERYPLRQVLITGAILLALVAALVVALRAVLVMGAMP